MKRGENLRKYDHSGPTYKTQPSEYRVWSSMKNRCTNPRFVDWHLYGGRGIQVCGRWRASFADFFADVGLRPSPKHTLDRWPNGDGNYEPGNVRWATPLEQGRNTSRNRQITANGETLSLAEWAERSGLKRETIADRLKAGWSPERAIETAAMDSRDRDPKGRYV